MKSNNLWDKAKQIKIQTSTDITGGFDVWFDEWIPEDTKNELIKFIDWVEANYNIPVTLYVEFEFKHYLLDKDKKRVGYLFYWVDFVTYPMFEDVAGIPIVRLPVRTGQYTIEEILISFIEAITYYFAWILGMDVSVYKTNEKEIDEILKLYLN